VHTTTCSSSIFLPARSTFAACAKLFPCISGGKKRTGPSFILQRTRLKSVSFFQCRHSFRLSKDCMQGEYSKCDIASLFPSTYGERSHEAVARRLRTALDLLAMGSPQCSGPRLRALLCQVDFPSCQKIVTEIIFVSSSVLCMLKGT
jgi:hypothetical protein